MIVGCGKSVVSARSAKFLRPFVNSNPLVILCLKSGLTKDKIDIKECLAVLEVEMNCSEEELRAAYLKKVKDYHPDRMKEKGDSTMFNRVYRSYQGILDHRRNQNLMEEEQLMTPGNDEEEEIFRHTAPQHRQYLTFEGVGYGTPAQRKRQYQQFKVARANERVYEHRKMKFGLDESAVTTKDKAHAQKIKTSNLIHRLVDDLVRESMQRGDFENLAGKGKPLDYSSHNPLVDTTTHNLNKILVNNGFAPEWIMLSKEIRSEICLARQQLAILREQLGAPPYSDTDSTRWEFHVDKFMTSVQNINKKINKFNFIVPFMEKQMFHYDADLNVQKVCECHSLYLPKDEKGNPIQASKLPQFPEKKEVNDKIHWSEVWSNIKDVFRYRQHNNS